MIRKATLADAAAIASVHVESWKTTYGGIVPATYLETLSLEEKQALWEKVLSQSDHSVFVVQENERVVGFVSGGSNRMTDGPTAKYDGELYAIYLLKEAQGKGLGHQLVQTLVSDLKQKGIHSMVVWVLADNPSCHFYERLGGEKIAEEEVEIGGKALWEWCYGWQDIKTMKS
ncbi:GNAT family N-acetyltransferase [Geobacillus thermodenitrificans]|jgi:L-amino acid N-acyltransferase YncA|uniref:GNAT family N-acetyltransferase n=1 Tax=Geobacillus thermodenitrificans TaxID=33940 RepID=UPI0003FAEC37|nr:GNAT family N-acetyltransferase [Geobacillus thermodenitrificans]ARA97366.1 GNAT family N-acetyltransferase [Geobacillus thermodenitrificans]MED3905121.1 GNAT family N-acetyltransferase [Geobacillus thermodenitrificans]